VVLAVLGLLLYEFVWKAGRREARARRGEVIQFYATGCGVTNPRVTDGVPPAGPAADDDD
jgi:uncharacterized protein (TIGR03437 family)